MIIVIFSHPDAAPLSTTVRNKVMSNFGGCRKWPYPGQSHYPTFLPHVHFAEFSSFQTLVHPLWEASFRHNANASYKNGVRLVHQNSHKAAISTCLLRWSYGFEPEVSPPAKIDWTVPVDSPLDSPASPLQLSVSAAS